MNIINFVLSGMAYAQIACIRNRKILFSVIYCSTFTLFLLFYNLTEIKMIFFKHSLITFTILSVAIWDMAVSPTTSLSSSEVLIKLRSM